MTHAEFGEELFHAFPSLAQRARDEFANSGDEQPGSYILFEDLLVAEIQNAAATNHEYLAKLMAFVEEVAKPGVGACDDLITVGLGEVIEHTPNADVIRAAAGPNTTKALWKLREADGIKDRWLPSCTN